MVTILMRMFASEHTHVSDGFGRVIVVASLGGLEATSTVLAGLPAGYEVPIVVMQHRRRTADEHDPLAAILAHRTPLPVQVAEHDAAANQPGITVVPAQTAATIDESGRWAVESSAALRPGDLLLSSSAQLTPTVAVILTGSLDDGADGCRAVKRGGGRVLVQDPATARASSMPANAIATGCVDFVLSPERIGAALLALTTAQGAADQLAVPLARLRS